MKRFVFLIAGLTACTTTEEAPPDERVYDWNDYYVASSYPDIQAIYSGETGIYRTCGPNNNVCHNGKEYPNLRSLEGLLDTIGSPCNQNREDQDEIHDWCERTGDALAVADQRVEIARIEPAEESLSPRVFRIHLQGEAPAIGTRDRVDIARFVEGGTEAFYGLAQMGVTTRADPENSAAILVDVPRAPETPEEYDVGLPISREFLRAGTPGDPSAIQVADPNGNGIYGVSLGHALIKPGAPEESYLMRRLIDPTFGVLMPLANCCNWRKESLRALWCWIAGLEPDGSNALEPIDYDSCPDGPVENLVYPVLGPQCEASGMCPVTAREVTGPPNWDGVWSIVQQSCSGSDCHVGGDAADFAVSMDQAQAYPQILTRITPGDPDGSVLYQHLLPTCVSPDCERMPFERPPLTQSELEMIRMWIANGALETEF